VEPTALGACGGLARLGAGARGLVEVWVGLAAEAGDRGGVMGCHSLWCGGVCVWLGLWTEN
jgi:hypothetical protein